MAAKLSGRVQRNGRGRRHQQGMRSPSENDGRRYIEAEDDAPNLDACE